MTLQAVFTTAHGTSVHVTHDVSHLIHRGNLGPACGFCLLLERLQLFCWHGLGHLPSDSGLPTSTNSTRKPTTSSLSRLIRPPQKVSARCRPGSCPWLQPCCELSRLACGERILPSLRFGDIVSETRLPCGCLCMGPQSSQRIEAAAVASLAWLALVYCFGICEHMSCLVGKDS